MEINVKKLSEKAILPSTATIGSLGADIYACLDEKVVIKPNERLLIPTGLAFEIPLGYGGFMFPRSSLGYKSGISIPNCVGVIDSDYRGELMVALINHSDENYEICHHDRIAQLVILPVINPTYVLRDELSDTVRGTGGFGSTGK